MKPRTVGSRVSLVLLVMLLAGCGTTRDKLATEQLLLSDAVDQAVARIDFSPLRGERVFLDDTYLKQVKGAGFVNADYIISSLRQQALLAGCLLQETRDQADFVAEARVGALGSDAHDVNYGMPGNQGLSTAASLVSGSMPLPALPEISLGRRTDDSAATKIAVFAYHRESREPAWQSGISVAHSRAKSRWVLGIGPIQSGSIYDGPLFAGERLDAKSLAATPLRKNPFRKRAPREPDPQDSAYRSMAVWSPKLQDKLDGMFDDGERLASLPEGGENAEERESEGSPPGADSADTGSPASE